MNARRLLLNLLLASGGEPLAARVVVSACALFEISENSARVTLARLVADGLIESVERGEYRLGAAGADLAQEVGAWRDTERKLRKWRGGWVAVHCSSSSGSASPSGSSNFTGLNGGRALRGTRQGTPGGARAQRARRERALNIAGFKPLRRGLLIRPDNLVGGVGRLRARLLRLGLEPSAVVFCLSDLDAEHASQALALWDGPALEREYAATRARLSGWLRVAKRLPLEEQAKQAFLLGDAAIRQVVFDPLLPEPLVSAAARAAFVEEVLMFDAAGRAIWSELYRAVKKQALRGSSATRALAEQRT